jgi:chromosomal replication initiation ATPase DnaA
MNKTDKYYSPEKFIEYVIPDKQDIFVEEFNKMFNGKLYATPVRVRRMMDYMLNWAQEQYNVTAQEIFNKTRQQDITIIRHVIMFALHENFKGVLSMTEIGKMFNKRDHCSVIHARNKCIENYNFDSMLKERIDSLNDYLTDKGIYVLQKYVH